MPVEVVMPKLGLTMASGTIARWIKRPGEAVREGEPLVEVATDKITYEVEAPATGTVARALGADGDEFACGDVIATIILTGETDTPTPSAPSIGSPAASSNATSSNATSSNAAAADAASVNGERVVAAAVNGERAVAASGNGERVVASPAARRLARECGIALRGVRGTGPRGRVTMADVNALRGARGDVASAHETIASAHETVASAGDAAAASAHGTAAGRTGADRVSVMGDLPRLPSSRRAIFRKMTEVGRLPLAQVETVARVDAVKALMERRRDFGWTAFAVYAVGRLLREHAELRTDATTGVPFERIGVGVAADTPHGLIVPVVRDADTRSLAEIQREIVRLAGRAREGALTGAEIGGACFSISNVGPQGVERVAPLPDPPQTAILGIGAATRRAAVVDGALIAAWMLTCVVSFDHRFVDGAPAARFLAAFAAACAEPGELL